MKKLLIAHDLQQQLTETMAFLDRAEIQVLSAPSNEELLKLHIEEHADIVITRPDLPGMACEVLLNIFRRSVTLRNVYVIMVCENTALQRDRSRKCGANAIMTRPVDTAALERQVLTVLNIVPRRSYRVVLNISVEGGQNGRTFLCNTENVSTSGILIRTAENLALGDRIACSFYLPDGTRVSASGDVARSPNADPQTRQNRYGIRFNGLAPAAKDALAAFVDRELRQRPGMSGSMLQRVG